MRLVIALLLLLLLTLTTGRRVAIIIDTAKPLGNGGKDALIDGFRKHIFNEKRAVDVSLFVGSEWTLTWTSTADQRDLIELAIRHIESDKERAVDWQAAFQSVAKFTPDANKVVLVTDASPANLEAAQRAAHHLVDDLHMAIYPIGLGPSVSSDAIKSVAGPCNRVFGCIAAWNYYMLGTFPRLVSSATILQTLVLSEEDARDPPKERLPPPAATVKQTTVVPPTPAPVVPAQFGDIVGHVYLRQDSDKVESRGPVPIVQSHGYAGVRITLTDCHGKRHVSVSGPDGDIYFKRIPVGMTSVEIDTPPGMEQVQRLDRYISVRSGGLNRMPPVELRFNARHHERTASELSGGDIAIIVVVSVFGAILLGLLIWLCCWCWKRPSEARDYMPFESKVVVPVNPHFVSPKPQGAMKIKHGLRSKIH